MKNSLLLALILPSKNEDEINEELIEMSMLANTIGYKINETIVQKKNKVTASTFFGEGKVREVANKASLLLIDTIFINDELQNNFRKD